MRNLKKYILIVIIILSIMTIYLYKRIYFESQSKQNEDEVELIKSYSLGDSVEDVLEKKDVSIISNMKTVEQCIQNYYDTINLNAEKYFDRNGNKLVTDEQINNSILNLLSDEYKEKNKINVSNIDTFIKKTNQKLTTKIIDMKYIKLENIYKYVTYGILVNSEYKLIDKYYLYVTIDKINKTYCIEPISLEEYNDGNMKVSSNVILNKNDNIYSEIVVGYIESIKEYIDRYNTFTLIDPKITYNLLNQEYKEKKFEDINKYIKYVDNNKERLSDIQVTKYIVEDNKDYIDFICADKNGFYYIIRKYTENCLKYEFFLDTYTLDSEDYIKTYNSSNTQNKIGLNIEKIMLAINSKDYDYVYDKLDNSFKSKYFDNAENLGAFLQKNLFDLNKISNGKLSNNGNGIYTCDLEITSYGDENNTTKNMTIIMKLLDNRDFTMSFSF